MKITRTRTHKFSMAPYEQLEISATVEIDTSELDRGTNPTAYTNQLLDDILQEDIDRADDTCKTPEDDTYSHAWKDALI